MISNIVRKLKLDNLNLYDVDDIEKKVIQFIKTDIFNLQVKYVDNMPEYIYYVKDEKYVLEYNIKLNFVFVNKQIFDMFYIFGYNDKDIRSMLKVILEYKYNMNNIDIIPAS